MEHRRRKDCSAMHVVLNCWGGRRSDRRRNTRTRRSLAGFSVAGGTARRWSSVALATDAAHQAFDATRHGTRYASALDAASLNELPAIRLLHVGRRCDDTWRCSKAPLGSNSLMVPQKRMCPSLIYPILV